MDKNLTTNRDKGQDLDHKPGIRSARIQVVAEDKEARTIDLRLVRYNVVDSYGTVWLPGCLDNFLRSEEQYLPLAVDHSWRDPIGHMVEYLGDDEEGPVVRFQLDDFDDVPTARRIYSQVKSGTLRECSIGFGAWARHDPMGEEREQFPGAVDMVTEVELNEVSVVLRGAVPGAKVVAVRSDEVFNETERDDKVVAPAVADNKAPVDDPQEWTTLEFDIDETLGQIGL